MLKKPFKLLFVYLTFLIQILIKYLLKSQLFLFFFEQINETTKNNTLNVSHKNFNGIFHNISRLTNYRYKTFSSKEPDTLDWIDTFSDGSIFWDIGANIGLYSIYAGKTIKDIKIYSFEPSYFKFRNSIQKCKY